MHNGSRSSWLSRHSDGCAYLLLYVLLLGAAEYEVIHRFVIPAPSTRLDWYVATCFVAPALAAAAMLGILFTGWLICLVTPRRKREDRKRYDRRP